MNMETWLSGRKHLTANEAGSKSPPGFESLRLRNETKCSVGDAEEYSLGDYFCGFEDLDYYFLSGAK